jgi:two-component system, sensor histidine kinase and response regulator
LFQPFIQADSSTSRNFGGTGLGLSIVKSLVELMGGTLGAESVANRGSTFWFMLPVEISAQPHRSAGATALQRHTRLLVVDDNTSSLHLLTAQLTRAGYQVCATNSGKDAISRLHKALDAGMPFDALITDSSMPGMDGASLGIAIKADPLLQGTPLMMLTSVDDQTHLSTLKEAGFVSHLTKPIKARALLECVAQLVTRVEELSNKNPAAVTRDTPASFDATYRGHVLVVDDNTVNQMVACRYLQLLGCEVTSAMNGAEAFRKCRETRFDLVFMDVQMPVMDGFEATRRIRALGGSHTTIPIVALTADAMYGVADSCSACGMNDMLTKPFDVPRLIIVLDRYLVRSQTDPVQLIDSVA